MLANTLSLFVLALAAAAGVSAQSPDACTLSCVQLGLANSTCSSLCVYILVLTFLYLPHAAHICSTDLACVCNSTSFKQTAANCLAANCTAADQQAAIQLQKQECGSMYLSPLLFSHRSTLLIRLPRFDFCQNYHPCSQTHLSLPRLFFHFPVTLCHRPPPPIAVPHCLH